MKVGDLVWVTGKPRDGWVPFLGIIIAKKDHEYRVCPCSHNEYTFLLTTGDMEVINESR